MKSTAKTLALGAALLCLLAGGMALPASAAVPLTGTAVSLPWNSDNSVPAESIEAGTYSSNMLLGETQQLSPTVRPRNSTDSVIYLTDDSSVLTVSNSGVVQAVGVGTATVTAAAGNQICAYTISVSMDSTMIVTEMAVLQHHLCRQLGVGIAAGAALVRLAVRHHLPDFFQ